MAAKYTKILRTIWANTDFVALNASEQRLYMMLFSQPDISACGVLPLMERRWGRLAADTDAASVLDSLRALATCHQPFIETDEETDEVWVRSYLSVDELWKVPNGRKAIDAALSAVASPLLRPRIERVYETLTGTLDETPDRRDRPPQQQAASSKTTTDTGSSSREQSGENCHGTFGNLPPAAAAAIDLLIEHKISQGAHNPTGLRRALRRDLPVEHGPTLTTHLARHPNADTTELAHLLGLNELDLHRLKEA